MNLNPLWLFFFFCPEAYRPVSICCFFIILQGLLEHDHIRKLYPALDDRMVIMILEEILYHMMSDKAALFIERNGQRAVACSDLKDGVFCECSVL